MGLDMYLSKKTYVQNWEFMKDEERHSVTVIGPRAKTINLDRITYIVEEVGYWRKANEIHAWFVNNVQDGVDDCRYSYVSREQLEDLLTCVIRVLNNHSVAADTLPTQEGFFFGSTAYDQMYFDDLEQTRAILERALSDPDAHEFEYHSSW